ncbi:MAG: hypothetical protein IJJ85_05900 [Clostridia bacterium]|nr:hypothetical protein [Clostridia bacterium]
MEYAQAVCRETACRERYRVMMNELAAAVAEAGGARVTRYYREECLLQGGAGLSAAEVKKEILNKLKKLNSPAASYYSPSASYYSPSASYYSPSAS